MDRELFETEPAEGGWRIVGVIPDSGLYPSRREAVREAAHLAYRYFLLTGLPAGVKVRMQCGDVVLAAQHG